MKKFSIETIIFPEKQAEQKSREKILSTILTSSYSVHTYVNDFSQLKKVSIFAKKYYATESVY